MFVSCLREKSRPDRATDRYRTALDGFRGPDGVVRTVAGGLRAGVGDGLSAWLNVPTDFIVGNVNGAQDYWNQVAEEFNANRADNRRRQPIQSKRRWGNDACGAGSMMHLQLLDNLTRN